MHRLMIRFLGLLSIMLMFSCGETKEITLSHVDDFRLQKLSLKEIEGELYVTIKNPNKMGFSIYRSDFDIYYGGVKLGKARLHKRVRIGPRAEKAYVFKLKSTPESLNLGDILKLIGNASSGSIRISGNLRAGKFFIKRSFPVDHTERIKLNQ